MCRSASVLSVALALLFAAPPAFPTTIDPMTWEQLVLSADFVGVVECTVAGGIVARYRVVDPWKGAEPGAEIAIRIAVNYWEPQFPIALCGKRYLVAAWKTHAPARVMSTTSGGGVPFWWRNLPADYSTPLFQGVVELPAEGEQPFYAFQSPHPALEVFQRAARCLIEAPPEQQEVLLMRALARKYLFDGRRRGDDESSKVVDWAAFQKELESLNAPDATVDCVLRWWTRLPEAMRWGPRSVFGQGAGPAALKRLEALPKDHALWQAKENQDLLAEIRRRLAPEAPSDGDAEKPAAAPSAAELERLRAALAKGPEDRAWGDALETLTVHDPASVAAHLAAWKNPERGWQDAGLGYVLGSYFGWRCGADRAKHLRSLLAAADGFVRAAAAVYLCFEDEEAGKAALVEASKLEGDPGAWAAITRVRRGDASAMERALEVLATPGDGSMAGVPHRNFQKHLAVVLSNSAQRSGVEPPPALPAREEESAREAFRAWWEQVREKIALQDPWLPELAAQKVD